MKKALMWMVAGFVFLVSSCSDLLDSPTGSLRLENRTSENVVVGLYISTSSDWGVNQLSSFLDTNESITITNIDAGTYSFKVAVSNLFYYEVEEKADATNTNVLTAYDVSSASIGEDETYTLTLLPTWLEVSNNSTNRLDYLYLNESGTFDLLNMVETNLATGDVIDAGNAFTFAEELVAGTYTIIAISENSKTNTYTDVVLTANQTNTLNITNF